MDIDFAARAKVFKALSDERRQMILDLLRNGEKCLCIITEKMEIPQSSLSYHMKILCESGIVKARVEGKWTHYSIDEEGSKYAVTLLNNITSVEPDGKKCCSR